MPDHSDQENFPLHRLYVPEPEPRLTAIDWVFAGIVVGFLVGLFVSVIG